MITAEYKTDKALRMPAPDNMPLRQVRPISRFSAFTQSRKYEILLFSFLLLIFGNTFTIHNPVTGPLFIYQNLFIGFIIFFHKKSFRYPVLAIILFSLTLTLFKQPLSFLNLRSWHGILYLIFFFLVVKEVYRELLYVKSVSREMLSAALCGFVMLCLTATFLFYQIDVEVPNSFSNAGQGRDVLLNLNYFSFTTMLTIGYGDITPVSMIARRAVMLMGLLGHFYTVFITSIIIGKYLTTNK
jgi:voltage-gated potassium channel